MWAESRWIGAGDEWLELRCTRRGVLERASAAERPTSPDAIRRGGVFSLVFEESSAIIRRLPSVYLGRFQIYSDREAGRVVQQTGRLVETILGAYKRPTYALRPCEVGGRRGLYARDLNNRSAYRLKLERLNVTFASDPWVTLNGDGAFLSRSWGPVDPTFVILGTGGGIGDQVVTARGAWLITLVTTYRLGQISALELHHLARALNGVEGVGAADPADVIAALTSDR